MYLHLYKQIPILTYSYLLIMLGFVKMFDVSKDFSANTLNFLLAAVALIHYRDKYLNGSVS